MPFPPSEKPSTRAMPPAGTPRSQQPLSTKPVSAKRVAPLVALALAALLAALWIGLERLGWGLPGWAAHGSETNLLLAHGPLMVSGFFGTLITVERAVALRRRWMFLAPLACGLGGALLAVSPALGYAGPAGAVLLVLGSLVGTAILWVMVKQEPRLYTVTMAVGPAGWPVYRLVLWWMVFLVLTIAGERLELSRVLRLTPLRRNLFAGAAGLFVAGAAISIINQDWGTRLAGVGMLALAAWLLVWDVARRNARHPNALTQYIAHCLLLGYVWLGVSGALSIGFGAVYAGPRYDAVLHSVFLGFVISMVFGHAPIILPAVLGAPVTYHPAYRAHLGLLHLSLALRVGSDLTGWTAGRLWGGLLNEVAVLLFIAVTAITIRLAVSRAARLRENRQAASASTRRGSVR